MRDLRLLASRMRFPVGTVIVSPPPSKALPGKARRVRDYTLTPGSAQIYNEGDVHSPRRNGPTRLLRIEGCNLEYIYSAFFEAI